MNELFKNIEINKLNDLGENKEWINKSLQYLENHPTTSEKLDTPIGIDMSSNLTELSDEDEKKCRDNGYSEEVIESISSKEELEIYFDAELSYQEVNGKPSLVKSDIDLEKKDDFGRTNLERMEAGLAPLDKNGKPIELHHIGQGKDAPLAELTMQEHRGKGNDTILHNKNKESEIDRQEFGKERAEHWKARAEQLKSQLSIGE